MQLCLPLIIKAITKAQSKIHLVYDGWTSTNYMVLFGVHARFLNENYQLQSILLGLPKIKGEHIGVTFAELAFLMTEKYQFMSRLGFTVVDNADNNDTMIQEIKYQITTNDYIWDHNIYRLRCLGYIIYFAAEDFFFKKAPGPENNAGWR